METSAQFAAVLPEPHIILGLRLLPLSLGRYRLLKRFDCPFVGDDVKDVSIQSLTGELFFALIVCGLPVSEFKELLSHPKALVKEARRFGRRAGKIVDKKGFSILTSFTQFKKYLDDGQTIPWKVLSKDGTDNQSAAHWSHNVEVTLRSRVGWSQHEIDEEPLTKALADFFKFMEGEGMVQLVSFEDYAFMEKMGAENAAALEQILNGTQP